MVLGVKKGGAKGFLTPQVWLLGSYGWVIVRVNYGAGDGASDA